jgi:2-oxoglutarate dehydrogenase E2 component (dihydrolipoamide succinyltransferase)
MIGTAEAAGIKLTITSMLVSIVTGALRRFPNFNASIDPEKGEIIYKEYYNIGIAVDTDKGLMVPVIKDADHLSMTEMAGALTDVAQKARDGQIALDDLQGGTFTISNGGIFGSLLSTPILNAPQTAILGMHAIQDRPVAINGEVVIRPMMYLAMSYDHRMLDGKEAVSFLVSVKEQLENPEKLLLNL